MKIITENAIYVQKNDIAYLNSTDLEIPATVYTTAFQDNINIIDNSNRFEYVKFESENDIEFFKKLDWIIDYNEIKDLAEEELMAIGQNASNERNNLAKKFNKMTIEEQGINKDIVTRCDLLMYKMMSLRDIIWQKRSKVEFKLPEELAPKDDKPKKLKLFRRKNKR